MRSKSGTVRYIEAHHNFSYQDLAAELSLAVPVTPLPVEEGWTEVSSNMPAQAGRSPWA